VRTLVFIQHKLPADPFGCALREELVLFQHKLTVAL